MSRINILRILQAVLICNVDIYMLYNYTVLGLENHLNSLNM